MVSVTLLFAVAHAGPCGELLAGRDLSHAVDLLQREQLHVNFEGYYGGPPITFRVERTAGPQEAVASLLAACGTPCAGYQVVSVDGRVDLRSKDGPSLLDALVELPPGERSFAELAKELKEALATSSRTQDAPFGGFGSNAHPTRRVSVPPLPGPVPVRDLLASLEVIPSSPPRPGRVPHEEAVGWLLGHGSPGQHQGVLLTLIDLSPRPEEEDWNPPDTASIEAFFDMRERSVRDNPAYDDALKAKLLERIEAERQATRELSARALLDCDP